MCSCIIDENFPPDHPNLVRRQTGVYDFGVFATGPIKAGDFISVFNGPIAQANKAKDLPCYVDGFSGRHAIQFARNWWRDGFHDRMARYLAHSCEPNCGIRNLFEIVAMKDIGVGEELTWHYAMTEDDHPPFDCLCGNLGCVGVIAGFSNLTLEQQISFVERYRPFISTWLADEHGLWGR